MTLTATATARAAPAAHAPVVEGWTLLQPLGDGRWSRVFRARPARRNADQPGDYAVKLLRPEYAGSQECVAMLRREAVLGRKISHAHVAAVLGSHVQSPPYFLILPYLEGATLDAAIGAGAATASDVADVCPRGLHYAHALWLARQTAQALAAVHESGWLHGDVKPANLHVAPSGHVTLLDLGLAQSLDVNDSPRDRTFAGSISYAAPETFCPALARTSASDVYSLGVVLFESLTGRRPFEHEDAECVAAAHLREAPPDLRSLAPQVPGRVARVVSRMLAKDPLRRPGIAECVALLAALEVETFGEGVGA